MHTWNDGHSQVLRGSPIITDTPLAPAQDLPPTHPDENEPPSSTLAAGTRGVKRVREETNDGNASESPPAKVARLTASQSLRHHLPEFVDTRDQEEALAAAPILTLKEHVLEQARSNNLIVIVPHIKASSVLINQLLATESSEGDQSPPSRTRCAVILVDDLSVMNLYVAHLEFENPSISLTKYTEDLLRADFDVWTDMLKYDAILMPSRVLLECLNNGAFTLSQLHLLVVTDGQGIKNQDSHPSLPVVQIMSNHYLPTESCLRPRIFALAVVGNTRRPHFDSKMLTLEITLDCKVFGVREDKRAEILSLPDRPEEVVFAYDNPVPEDTRLLNHLHKLEPSEKIFRRYFRASRHVNHELGACASDLVWRRALKDIESGLIPYFDYDEDDFDITPSDRIKASTRDVVKNWPFAMPNLDRSSRGFNVSLKFLRLLHLLLPFRHYGEGFRGIIFVQKRITALVLVDLLRTLDDRLGFLRPYAFVGTSSEHKGHQDVFLNFTTGFFNLLVGTKSMEDLDIPKASVVIRFDLFESQISHAYVRARTRGRESHLIHMVERGNDAHRRILSRITNIDTAMIRWTEILCKGGEYGVPPSSLRETTNPYHSDSEGEDEDLSDDQCLKDPTTGGRICIQDATTVVYRYTASLRDRGLQGADDHGLFEYQTISGGSEFKQHYIATVNLTETPIDGTSGEIRPSKAQARRSACFKACEVLLKGGYLDTRLVPVPSRLRPREELKHSTSEGDTYPEAKTAGTKRYPRKIPDFWANTSDQPSVVLYPTIVDANGSHEGPFGPMAIMTKQPLPDQRPFRLFSNGATIQVRMYKAQPLNVTEEQCAILHRYTIRIYRGITNRAAVCDLGDAPYYFMPLSTDWRPPSAESFYFEDIGPFIPWRLVESAAENWATPIRCNSEAEMEELLDDAIIQDRAIEFTRRYRVVRVRNDLTPLSKPQDSQREAGFDNLFEFCKFRRKGLETLSNFDQPIAEVAKLQPMVNHLNPTYKSVKVLSKAPVKYLIPELCAKFTIPASTFRTAFLLPSILRRIDELLLVKELNAKYFDHVVREDLLHMAVCTPAAGMEYNYERLELLGDAFLKYLSSVYVFVTNPSLNEGSLHVARQKLISNKSLLKHAIRIGLPPYIQAKTFLFKLWLPPNFRIFVPPKVPKNAEAAADEIQGNDIKDKDDEERRTSVIEDDEAADPDATRDEDAFDISNVTEPIQVPEPQPDHEEEDPELEPGELIESPRPRPAKPETTNTLHPAGDSRSIVDDAELQTQTDAVGDSSGPKKKGKGKRRKMQLDEQNSQWLGDKAVADVMEAIIGAAYVSGGREAALQVTKSLNIDISNADRWSDFGRKVLAPPPNASAMLAPSTVAAIEKIIGHKFARPHILAQAMTHGSIQGYESTSYERLEFVGDAILDFMVIRYIFDRDQQLSPGALTLLKGAMVSNSTLAAVCVWSGLHEHFLYESAPLANSIEAYAQELQARQREEYILAKQEGRSVGQYWLSIEPPKALSDVVESIIGAVYISDNFSPIGAEALFDNVLKPFYDKHITLQTLSHHPTKILFELVQAQGCQHFAITKDKEGDVYRCSVLIHDVVLAVAQDASATAAARQVSFFALDALEGDADFMTRTCDCRTRSGSKKVMKRVDFERALERELNEDGELDRSEEAQDASRMVET